MEEVIEKIKKRLEKVNQAISDDDSLMPNETLIDEALFLKNLLSYMNTRFQT